MVAAVLVRNDASAERHHERRREATDERSSDHMSSVRLGHLCLIFPFGTVPELLRQHATLDGEAFRRCDERQRIATRS